MTPVSVCMAAFNAEPYVGAAIESVLAQSHAAFELIVVDDGSTDRTWEVVESLARRDGRIRAIRQEANRGLIETRNRLIEEARHPYLATADADDLFHHDRLATQAAFLDGHPEVGVLGSGVDFLVEGGGEPPFQPLYETDSEIRFFQRFLPCFWNSSTIYRKEALHRAGGYRPAYADGAEDYDLWARFAEECQLANARERLVTVRVHANSLTASGSKWLENVFGISARLLGAYLGRELDAVQRAELHRFLTLVGSSPQECGRCLELLEQIRAIAEQRESRPVVRQWRRNLALPFWTHSRYLVYREPSLSRRLLRLAWQCDPRAIPAGQVPAHLLRLAAPQLARKLGALSRSGPAT